MSTKWAKPFANSDYRRTVALAHVGWWGTAGIALLRAFDVVPQQVGSLALLTLGMAVASSLALSRMRLAETITSVFHVGLQAAITMNANVFTDTCIMVLDADGKVESADHADAIGWDEGELIGRELRALLTPRSHGVRRLRPGTSIISPMQNQKSELFDARLSFAALNNDDTPEHRLIVTISPVVAINSQGNYR